MIISLNIKNLRNNLNISQAFLAEKCGLSPSAICLYESGEREPNLESLIKLSKFFKVKIDDLINCEFKDPCVLEFEATILNFRKGEEFYNITITKIPDKLFHGKWKFKAKEILE